MLRLTARYGTEGYFFWSQHNKLDNRFLHFDYKQQLPTHDHIALTTIPFDAILGLYLPV